MTHKIKPPLVPARPGLRFYSSKIYHLMRLELSNPFDKKDPIVVFQMGKTGSLSIVTSLKAVLPENPIYHVHYITESGMEFYQHNTLTFGRTHLGVTHWVGHYLRNKIQKNRRVWNVITLVRDPIARNISGLFQRFKDHEQSLLASDNFVQKLTDILLSGFWNDTPLDWFDTEMKPVFGIDVFASPFPTEAGYQIYRGERANLLLIRLEDLNRVKDIAFKEFIGLGKLDLVAANITSERDSADLYREFLKKVDLPEEYISKMYASKFAKHFYSPQEIEKFRSKWLKKK